MRNIYNPVMLSFIFINTCFPTYASECVITNKGSGVESTSSGALFFRNINVVCKGGIHPEKVINAFMTRNITGRNGICISCTSTTLESLQNKGTYMYAENVSPVPVPTYFRGTASGNRVNPTRVRVRMKTNLIQLDADITAEPLGFDGVRVKERGVTSGFGANLLSQGHLKYFELEEALRRALSE